MGNMVEYPQNTANAGGRAKEETQPDGGAGRRFAVPGTGKSGP